jgi:hypothetical protein
VTIARLSTEKIVGGYTATSWSGEGYAGDSRSFLFSLSTNYRHSKTARSFYQYNNPSNGPTFGAGHDFVTGLGGTIGSGVYCNIGHDYECRIGDYGSSTCQNDFCGTYGPTISDLEVWYSY